MIALLSPAKTLDFETELPDVTATKPVFADRAEAIARGGARLGAPRLAKLMHISDKLAKLNAKRFREFDQADQCPALFAFAGDVYRGFEASSLDTHTIDFAQGHVRILSGLYGLLRPLDSIRPYRLEMGTGWAPGRADNLYAYWKDAVADEVASAAKAAETDTILNLASQEYWKVVDGKLPGDLRVIDIDFREPGPDGPRFVSFSAKVARGLMARWMCDHRITEPDGMKSFDSEGYRYVSGESTDTRWRFMRG